MATAEIPAISPRETVVDAIVKALIRYIAENRLAGGDRLPSERKLVEMIGASRLPLREALSVLKGLGIVETRHGKGIFVRQLDPAAVFGVLSPLLKVHAGIDARHVFEARLPLETGIARLAARKRTDENLAALTREIGAMAASIENRPQFVVHDKAFHQELAHATGNPVYVVFMASITDLLAELHEQYRDHAEFRRAALREHQQILDAIGRRDSDEAAQAIGRHLAGALKRM